MINVVICNDDKEFVLRLKRIFCKIWFEDAEYAFDEYSSGEEMLESIDPETKIDLLILDIQLPGMNGDTVAKRFREKFPTAVLILCSAKFVPTIELFEAEPYRYLLKTFSDEEMSGKLKEAVARVVDTKLHSYITVRDKDGQQIIRISDIAYLEIKGKGCEINFVKDEFGGCRKILINKKMSDMYERLKDCHFIFAHKSFLVNFAHIATIKSDKLILVDGTEIPLAGKRAKEFRQMCMHYADKC